MSELARLPRPEDFAPPPTATDRRRWEEAQCYIHAREMDLGNRRADEEKVNLDKMTLPNV